MPHTAYPGLLSERRVADWYLSAKPSPAADRHARLVDQVGNLGPEGLELWAQFDELSGDVGVEVEDELLLLVGTVLVRHSQRALWQRLYKLVTSNGSKAEANCFLKMKTAAVRRGAF